MQDLEIIQILEEIIGYRIGRGTVTGSDSFYKGYLVDEEDRVIKLAVNELSSDKAHEAFTYITRLVNLRYLSLHSSEVYSIDGLQQLTNLEELMLGLNSITDISPLESLVKLGGLDLSSNQISDLGPITNLELLTSLVVSGNKISNITPLRNLKNLTNLNIRDNQIKDISDLAQLTNLTILDSSENKITDFSPISNLSKLRRIVLHKTKVRDLKFLGNLIQVQELFLGENSLKNISPLHSLKNLRHLYLFKNQIADISPLKDLEKLETVVLDDNQIKQIEPWILKWNLEISMKSTSWGISLKGNPLTNPPLSVVKRGNTVIDRYFSKVQDQGVDYIYEVKLTLVGDGSSGKTSLKIRLIDPRGELPEEDKRTRGIKIDDWTFKKTKGKNHVAHIWDFGGQDVYYPVHRFFLTENSVFVLLASTRIAQNNFDYWIPTIYQFGSGSPILIAQTCHDGNKAAWNDLGIYLANPNFNIIKTHSLPYYELNLVKRNEGLKQLKDAIIAQITNLPHYGRGVPHSWVAVRDQLPTEAKKHSLISFSQFEKICKKADVKNFSSLIDVEDCAKFLHSIGIILWYSDVADLKDIVVLKPEWAMNAVYKIIDDDRIQKRQGTIEQEDFDRLWRETIYLGKHDILKKMLQVFKISFPKKHKKQEFIIPARLLSMPAGAQWKNLEPCLRLIYQFDFMPKGLVNQLSAELSRYIIGNEVWNNAVNFSSENNRGKCQVSEDLYNRVLNIKANGKDARFLAVLVMHSLNDITEEYKGVHPKILLQCPCSVCIISDEPEVFSYEKLLRKAETNERAGITCNVSDETFLIEELLNSVGLQVKQIEKNKMMGNNQNIHKSSKLFVSYSKFDEDYLQDFEDHLVTLKHEGLITFNCREIEFGKEWDKEIKKEINECDIMVCLVSVKFLNTDYITKIEIPKAIEQNKIIVPIIIKACDWENSALGKYQAAQRGKVVSLDNNQRLLGKIKGNTDEEKAAFWTDIVKELRKKLFK